MEYSEEEGEQSENEGRNLERMISAYIAGDSEGSISSLDNREEDDTRTVVVIDDTRKKDQVTRHSQKSQAAEQKAGNSSEEAEIDSDQACPICMEPWTTTGEHRLCCLRCGHLFGHSCVLKWLQVSCPTANRRCPQCNKKAAIKDIRTLYAKKLISIDTSELESLKNRLSSVTSEKNLIEAELLKCNLRQKLYEQQLSSMKRRISELEGQLSTAKEDYKNGQRVGAAAAAAAAAGSRKTERKFHLEHSMEICKEDGCRVLDHNPWYGLLAVSQKSGNPLFAGYGIKKVDMEKFAALQFIHLHSQAIRDISFHPSQQSILLSVGFDKCAKLIDFQNNVVMHTYATNSTLWSCCWSGDDSNIFFTGAQNGVIMQFDIRQTSSHVGILENCEGERSPVVSLATVPAGAAGSGISRGGFIACRLNTCSAYEKKESSYVPKQMQLQGPFVSVRYDKRSNHALISCRPHEKDPHARHIVCSIEKGNDEMVLCNVVHTLNAGNSQRLMSRPCHIRVENDTLIAAHQESTKSIPFWSTSTGRQIYSLPVSDPIIDMTSFKTNDNVYLATLSARKLRIYNHSI